MLTAPAEDPPGTAASLVGAAVTLVLPCLNEAAAVGGCVEAASAVFAASGLNGSVLVVDNGSTDGSVEVARNAGARVVRQVEPGYGAALRSGLETATTEYVVIADADGTYELGAIPRLLQPLVDDEADVVLGSRLDGATVATMPWLHRRLGTPVLTRLVNRAAGGGTRIRDSQSGLRAFRRSQQLELGLTATGMEFATEMLIQSSWARLRIREVPTSYHERIGRSKLDTFPDGLRHLRQILLLSPDAFASLPGIAMITVSLAFWGIVCFATEGQGIIGSYSWMGIVVATVFGVMGPMTYCTGLVVKYRAESLGLRHAPPKRPMRAMIWRFFYTGVALLTFTAATVIFLAVNLREHLYMNLALNRVLDSMATCTAIVGIILALSPLISPLILQSPVRQLPPAEELDDPARDAAPEHGDALVHGTRAEMVIPDRATASH
ncbi:MAG TPA: glycosyltransferase family 2 protein [Acidimicrobiales bacterium]|nr:glycosyltransferase family 2 protein [Acidimicrobiales bacterium]